jgi:hypothetical protein
MFNQGTQAFIVRVLSSNAFYIFPLLFKEASISIELYLLIEIVRTLFKSLHISALVSNELNRACAVIIQQLLALPSVPPFLSKLLNPF